MAFARFVHIIGTYRLDESFVFITYSTYGNFKKKECDENVNKNQNKGEHKSIDKNISGKREQIITNMTPKMRIRSQPDR